MSRAKQNTARNCKWKRPAAIAIVVAILLVVLLGFTALAVDVGILTLTRTQLQAATDSATLAAGTELMPGLGRLATKTPAEVEASARPMAQQYAAANRNALRDATFLDSNRDVQFGQAVLNPATGAWVQTIGLAPYNMVRTTVLRNQDGSSSGDGPISLVFARALGIDESFQHSVSAAVIMPARGFSVTEDGQATNLMPFAFKERVWRRLELAQNWYRPDGIDGGTQNAVPQVEPDHSEYPWMSLEDDEDPVPLFHRHAYDNQGDLKYDKDGKPVWEQDIFDNFHADPPETTGVASITGGPGSPTPDGILEVDIYPESTGGAITAGNAGTVDLGDTSNAAQAIGDQILNGLTMEDYTEMESQGILDANGDLTFDSATPTMVNGDTGISGGPIQHAMDQIIGETRAILLYTEEVDGPGNTVQYPLVEIVGIRVLFAKMSGKDKSIWVQMAPHLDGTAIPDTGEVPGPNTTVFTPLILIE